jgi:hypothetical protein
MSTPRQHHTRDQMLLLLLLLLLWQPRWLPQAL